MWHVWVNMCGCMYVGTCEVGRRFVDFGFLTYFFLFCVVMPWEFRFNYMVYYLGLFIFLTIPHIYILKIGIFLVGPQCLWMLYKQAHSVEKCITILCHCQTTIWSSPKSSNKMLLNWAQWITQATLFSNFHSYVLQPVYKSNTKNKAPAVWT